MCVQLMTKLLNLKCHFVFISNQKKNKIIIFYFFFNNNNILDRREYKIQILKWLDVPY